MNDKFDRKKILSNFTAITADLKNLNLQKMCTNHINNNNNKKNKNKNMNN